MKRSTYVFFLAALLPLLLGTATRAAPPSKLEIVRIGKPATALVELPNKKEHATAFCIHPSGVFITNEHATRLVGVSGTVKLVFNTGLKTQTVVSAKVIRVDLERDLALLRAEKEQKLPVLELGSDANLEETMELMAFGYPFGTALAVTKGQYPAISVSTGKITSLRRKNGELHRIQLDGALNPGNSGGPILDGTGKVVGIVVSGVRGAGVTMAIPISHVHQFVDSPVITFEPPEFEPKNQNNPQVFQARATSVLPSPTPVSLELVLGSSKEKQRRFPMKLTDGVYQATAIPRLGAPSPRKMRFTVKFPDGLISGDVEDQKIKLDKKTYQLSEVRAIRFGKAPKLTFWSDKTVEGQSLDLEQVPVRVGDQLLQVNLAKAAEAAVAAPRGEPPVTCTIVARRGKKEVGRLTRRLGEVLILGFPMPQKGAGPTSYLRVVSTSPKDFIGQGKTYSYTGGELRIRTIRNGLGVSVDGWRAEFAAPRGQTFKAAAYNNAMRYPFNDNQPGLSFSGKGRGANKLSGKFVVWELSVKNGQVTRLAIDFEQRCEETQPPLRGKLRFNSTYE